MQRQPNEPEVLPYRKIVVETPALIKKLAFLNRELYPNERRFLQRKEKELIEGKNKINHAQSLVVKALLKVNQPNK